MDPPHRCMCSFEFECIGNVVMYIELWIVLCCVMLCCEQCCVGSTMSIHSRHFNNAYVAFLPCHDGGNCPQQCEVTVTHWHCSVLCLHFWALPLANALHISFAHGTIKKAKYSFWMINHNNSACSLILRTSRQLHDLKTLYQSEGARINHIFI